MLNIFTGIYSKTEALHCWNTGWFKANLDTLTGDYDKYTMCFEKIVVELFSVHMDISFHSNKSEKNNCLYSKNFNWKLGP